MYNLLAGTSANKWFQLPIFLFFLPPFMKLRYLHLSVQQNDRSRSHNSVLVFCCSYIKRTSGCGHTVWCSGHAKSASYSLDGIAEKAGPHSVAACEFVTGGWSSLGLEMCLDLKSILPHPSWLQKSGWLCILKVKTAVYAQNVKDIVNALDFQSFISSMHKYKRTHSQKVEQFRYLCLMFSCVWLFPPF